MTAPSTTPPTVVSQGLHMICQVEPNCMYSIDKTNPDTPPTRENVRTRFQFLTSSLIR